VRPMKSIAHKSFVLYHNNFFVNVSNKMELHCDECDQVFTNKKNKYRHMKAVHLKIKPFKCDKCEKSFPYDNMKSYHKEVHDPVPMEIKSSCNQCGKTFSNVDNLLKHKNFNFDDACQKCDTDFCNSTQLNMHNKKERLKCTKC
jgi:KRAB domain-containing zinc finger protein